MKLHLTRLTLSFLILLGLSIVSNLSPAQTVSLQIFNGASGITLDTLDVYINGTKLDNIPLGYFTKPVHVPSGNTNISINKKTSTSISDQVLKTEISTFTYSTGGFEAYNIFILGVETPAEYASNPNGKNTGLHIWSFPKGRPKTIASTQTGFTSFIHGSTDLPKVNYITRKDTLIARRILFDGLSDVSLNASTSSTTQTLDIVDSLLNNYYGSFDLPLNVFKGKIIFPFVTGFLNPSNNKNGLPLTLFMVDWFDTSGSQTIRCNSAPKPRGFFQFIHNSATTSMDTIDVYINGVKYNSDNLAFRKGTHEVLLNAGLYNININRKNSSDSGNLLIKRVSTVITKNKNTISMLVGTDSTTLYASNPNGKDRSLQLLSFLTAPNTSYEGNLVRFVQGCTDALAMKFESRRQFGSTSDLTNFGDAPKLPLDISILDSIIDLTVAESEPPLRTFEPTGIPTSSFQRGIVFSSGFLDPSKNRNGSPLTLVYVDSTGNSIMLNTTAGVRFLHNSADTSIPKVDIWIDNNPMLKTSSLGFRKCSNTVGVSLGKHILTVMKAGSTDTSDISKQLYQTTFDFRTGKNYIMMLCGVKDTSRYAPNPDSLNIGLQFIAIDNFSESYSESSIRFVNGVTDAKSMINPIGIYNTPYALAPFALYNPRVGTASPPYNMIFRSKDSTITYALLRYSTYQSSLVFSSGFANKLNNPKSGASLKFFILTPDNEVTEATYIILPRVQFINLSNDIPTLNIYANKKLIVKDLKQFNISPVIELLPTQSYQIEYATRDSAPFYSNSLSLSGGQERTYIAYGLKDPGKHKVNPDGYSTAFATTGYFDVKRTPNSSGSFEICLFMAASDLSFSPIRNQSPLFNVHSVGNYGFADRYETYTNENIKWQMMNKDGSIVKNLITGKVSQRSGLSGIAFIGGFSDTLWKNTQGQTIQAGLPIRAGILWPDGKIDTLSIGKYTNLEELGKTNVELQIYPSPASSSIEISSPIPYNRLSIFNVAGSRLIEEEIPSSIRYKLNISSLSKGVYFLQIVSTTQELSYKKFIVE